MGQALIYVYIILTYIFKYQLILIKIDKNKN